MKKIFIVANWKSNKTQLEAQKWLQELSTFNFQLLTSKEIIVCPSFIHLPLMKAFIEEKKLPIKLGVQNISPFDEGAYTGEVNGKQIKEFAEFVLIGHSERRKNFFENDEIVNKKVEQAIKYDLTPILCMSDIQQIKNEKFKIMVAYEPLFAIGSGIPDTPENAESIADKIKEILDPIPVLYGGSVTSKNVKKFTQMSNIDGVLIGGASLDAQEFYTIIQNT